MISPQNPNVEESNLANEQFFIELKVDQVVLFKVPVSQQEIHNIGGLLQRFIKQDPTTTNPPVQQAIFEEAKSLDNKFINDANKIILENLNNEDFGVNELCRALGTHRMQVHRTFKSTLRVSASRYIQIIRMEKAKKLLRMEGALIREVAFEVGYTDPCYFTRVFSRLEGMSPSEFIKKQSK